MKCAGCGAAIYGGGVCVESKNKFRKYGVMKFIGHLDIMRYFQKAMRRAEIPIAFTGGYSPHMVMSFANPLGVGLTSDGEYFDIELSESVDFAQAVRRLNEAMVEGMEIVNMIEISDDKKKPEWRLSLQQIICLSL